MVCQPQVSVDRVVWVGLDFGGPEDFEVFTWTPAGGLLQITDDDVDQLVPQVSDDRVVWKGNLVAWDKSGGQKAENFDFEIFTWTPTDGTVRITSNELWDENPQVSGDRVVWRGQSIDPGDNWEVFTWTPTDGVVQLTDNDLDNGAPQASGDRVVWADDEEVFTWTPAGGVIRLGQGCCPDVSGERVVWWRSANDDRSEGEILTWTPSDGVVHVASTDFEGSGIQVSGDRIVWSGSGGSDSGSDSEVFTWTPAVGVVEVTMNDLDDIWPQISGNRIAWGVLTGDSLEILTWTPGADPPGRVIRIADEFLTDAYALSGDWLVWNAYVEDDAEIFLTELDRP